MTAVWVLQGGPVGRDGAGVCVDLSRGTTSGPNAEEDDAYAAASTRAFRCSPLVRVEGVRGQRTLLVGQVRIWKRAGERLRLHVALQSAWVESEEDGWGTLPVEDVPAGVVRTALGAPRHVVPDDGDDLQERQRSVAVVAKAVAEGSRNAVAELRGLRYELEERLASVVRPSKDRTDATVLPDLVELSIAVNRARDQAREAAREGLWAWHGDDEAYQRHRAALDPTLLNGVEPTVAATRRWMGTHDAAVRQCLTAERLLGEEADVLARLLAGASTLVVSRDAETQQRFNAVVTLGGLGLALPALVLAVYGVDGFAALTPAQQALAFVPATAAALAVALYAGHRLQSADADAGRLRRHPWTALWLTLALLLLLGAATLFFPDPGATPSS